jgi:hypothetical protein
MEQDNKLEEATQTTASLINRRGKKKVKSRGSRESGCTFSAKWLFGPRKMLNVRLVLSAK